MIGSRPQPQNWFIALLGSPPHLSVRLLLWATVLLLPHLSGTPLRVAASVTIPFNPPPPPDVGEPTGRGQGGGTRGPECAPYEDVAALVPTVMVGDRPIQWGQTTEAHPTVWIATPLGLEAGLRVEFTLRDARDATVYRSIHEAIATEPGSLSFTPRGTFLEVGELYAWSVSIFCDVEVPDVPVTVGGYIQRVESLADSGYASTNPLQRSAEYAAAGIWYDALTVLGHSYTQSSDPAIGEAWSLLLQQVSLGAIAHVPVVR
jgi:hypothetical protein